jgi:glycosyltransferase involved in cell wall biosynthesis
MISIILPAYNEEESIQDTIRTINDVMRNSKYKIYEIIVVDDGSNDSTYEEAKKLKVKVLRHPHNIGYGSALKNGINNARYNLIVISDADGTYPISQIPNLIEEHKRYGFDMVVGARSGEFYRESALKYILRFILKKIVEFTAGRKIPDINSGLRLFEKKTIVKYFDRLCDRFSFTTSLTLAYIMTGKFVKYIPINYEKRNGKTKVRLFSDSIKTIQYILEAVVFYNPLKIFFAMSVFCLITSFIILSLALIFHIASFFILGVGSILLSILVMSIGFLAVLLKQIMLSDSDS